MPFGPGYPLVGQTGGFGQAIPRGAIQHDAFGQGEIHAVSDADKDRLETVLGAQDGSDNFAFFGQWLARAPGRIGFLMSADKPAFRAAEGGTIAENPYMAGQAEAPGVDRKSVV